MLYIRYSLKSNRNHIDQRIKQRDIGVRPGQRELEHTASRMGTWGQRQCLVQESSKQHLGFRVSGRTSGVGSLGRQVGYLSSRPRKKFGVFSEPVSVCFVRQISARQGYFQKE